MKRRCAVYTRKSTDEGLEQSFNSLDAQREACAAYILSQAHEGWEPVREQYDDGGWSGGNMARPALEQLLADVTAGKVDVIVVYKVDRLTRSLADFARIVEALDKAGASFVSVTQAFNTTTSMGRLTLNVLLSFAQFEREVTSERIRDKIAASKKKGMWMGGPVPLGYRLIDRKLVVDDNEAERVRHIFARYLELGSMGALADELAATDVCTKVRQFSNGRSSGGVHFTVGSLAQLLKNPVFAGKTRHRDKVYDGEHEPIIDLATWKRVQEALKSNTRARLLGEKVRFPSLLTGLITDPEGRGMTPTFTSTRGVQHRYYVSRVKAGEDRNQNWRVSAAEIESAVIGCLERRWRGDQEVAAELEVEKDHCDLRDASLMEQRDVLLRLDVQVQLASHGVRVRVGSEEREEVEFPAKFARRGKTLKLILEKDSVQALEPDAVLFRLIAHAYVAQQSILSGISDPLLSKYSSRHIYKLMRLTWLAPDILTAIAEGKHPLALRGRHLLRAGNVPLDWAGQRSFFGFRP